MKILINEKDIRNASNTERCKLIKMIIKGQAIYYRQQDIYKEVMYK